VLTEFHIFTLRGHHAPHQHLQTCHLFNIYNIRLYNTNTYYGGGLA